ncbi:hypothetical protein D3C80_1187180 [compost metagenome]
MAQCGLAAGGQLPGFDPHDPVVGIEHQAAGLALATQAHTLAQGAGLEWGVQAGAGHARAFGPVPARRWLGVPGIGRHGLVTGVIEVVLVAGVGRLVRWYARFERHALAFQPGQLFAAALAEVMQGRVADCVADFLAQVIEHGFAAVVVAGLALVGRTATGIDHATTQCRGTTTFETVQCRDLEPPAGGLDGRASTGATETDDQQITAIIPARLLGAVHPQWRQRLKAVHGAGLSRLLRGKQRALRWWCSCHRGRQAA